MPTTRSLGLGLVVLGLGIGMLVPVFLSVYPSAGITPADATRPEIVLPVFAANPTLVTLPAAVEIVVHVIGAVTLLGLWARFGATSFLLACATLGGLVWMTLDITDNAITFHVVPMLAADDAAGVSSAGPAFVQLAAVVDAVRLAAHLVGGLWMIGFSLFAMQAHRMSWVIGWLGVAVGGIFAANLFAPALLNVSFMTVPAWLVIAGIVVSRAHAVDISATLPRLSQA